MRLRLYSLWLAGAGVAALGVGAAARLPYLHLARGTHPHTGQPLVTPGKDGDATLLFNGWKISPAGRPIATGDFLLGGAISPDGKTLAICNAGYGKHALHIVDIATEKESALLPIPHALNGLVWSGDSRKIYVGGGVSAAGNDIYTFEQTDGKWAEGKILSLTGSLPASTCVAGLALSQDGKTLYALNNSDNKLYILDALTGAAKSSLVVGDHPYACRVSSDGQYLIVCNLGGKEVAVVDAADAVRPTIKWRVPTGEHPNALAFSSDNRMFVSCGNEDTVHVYDTTNGDPIETIRTRLAPDSPSGSTPCSVALSPDNKTLYVANADNNDVAVIDVSKAGSSRVKGFHSDRLVSHGPAHQPGRQEACGLQRQRHRLATQPRRRQAAKPRLDRAVQVQAHRESTERPDLVCGRALRGAISDVHAAGTRQYARTGRTKTAQLGGKDRRAARAQRDFAHQAHPLHHQRKPHV